MVRALSGLIVLVALARAVSAEEMVHLADPSGRFSVEVPAAWQMAPVQWEGASLSLEGELPGKERVLVAIYVQQGPRDALAHAWFQRDVLVRDKRTEKVEVFAETPPVLHAVYQEAGTRWLEATEYSMVRRNLVSVRLICPPDAWPKVKDWFRPIVDSVQARVDEWPAPVPGFESRAKDGYLWFVQEGVSGSALRKLQKLVRETERRFERVHGKVQPDPENPPFVMVCKDADAIVKVAPDIGNVRYGARGDPPGGRVFLTPLPAKDGSGAQRAQAAARIWDLLYVVRYGLHYPYWVYVAEGSIQWSENLTGERLPLVTREIHKRLPKEPIPLSELLRLEQGEYGDTHSDNGLAYVLFFRAGPAKYRKAWDAFLEDYAATKDATGAIGRHLSVLDEERLQEDLRAWIAKSVRPAKGR